MRFDKSSMLLYAVTDRAFAKKQTLYEQVNSAIKGGITMLQLREKELSEAEFLKEAEKIKPLCRANDIPFIINDDVDVAVKCGADGVHIGQNDMAAEKVRQIIGNKMILGVSAQTVEQAIKAENAGADYLGVGAVFPTSTKTDALSVSYETLKEICASVSIPVVALGGNRPQTKQALRGSGHKGAENIKELSGSGIDGVALVSAIFGAEDIERECEILKKLTREVVS